MIGIATVALVIRWWTFDPAAQLEVLVATVPPPAGLHPDGPIEVVGDRPAVCGVNPSCRTQNAGVTWVADARATDLCARLEAASADWASIGFVVHRPRVATQAVCALDGTLDGHPAGVQVFAEPGEVTQMRFTVRW